MFFIGLLCPALTGNGIDLPATDSDTITHVKLLFQCRNSRNISESHFFHSFVSKFCTSTKKKLTGDKPQQFCENQPIPRTKKCCDSKTFQAIAIPNILHRRGSESQTTVFGVSYHTISGINRGPNLKWPGSKEVSEDRFLLREKELRFRLQVVVRLMGWDCKAHKLLYLVLYLNLIKVSIKKKWKKKGMGDSFKAITSCSSVDSRSKCCSFSSQVSL